MEAVMKKKTSGGVIDTIKTVVYAVAIAIFVRTVAFEPFNIPSASMVPTLLVGDYLFVSKYAYGYSRYSLPLGLNLFSGRIFFHQPERGDVAVFRLPSNPSTDYIKRIVGLPGDRIQVIAGVLQINGVPVKREKIEPFVEVEGFRRLETTQYIETLPSGRRHPILERYTTTPLDNTPVFDVPPGYFFAMGDNRDNSSDSRVDPASGGVGFVPFENLVGRAEFLFFSTDGSARIWEIWRWPLAIRYERLFRAVR
jgi:signal peptidase I